MFKDSKRVSRSCKSKKEIPCNGQKKRGVNKLKEVY